MSPLSFPHGFYDEEWQKSPIPFGVSSVLNEKVENLNLLAGLNTLQGSVCPAGEIWVITNIYMRYNGTASGVRMIATLTNTISLFIFDQITITSLQGYDRQGNWIVLPGGSLSLTVVGATLNDDARIDYSGYKLDIDL